MQRKLGFLIVLSGLFFGLASCGSNSKESCTEICTWWHDYCYGETLDGCVADCQDADEDADDIIDRCVDGNGWSEPSSCTSASCCVGFTYDEYYYDQKCL